MINTILRSHYKIIEVLGKGGFGETYIAEDIDLPDHPRFVVKRLHPDVIDPDIIRLFDTEAKILYTLGNHEQIPNLKAHFQENNEFYLIQDLIIGHDLSQEITPGKQCHENYVIKFLKDVSNVLSFVHQNNVIHRDIKPQNIIRRQGDGKLILIDFGAVKTVKQHTMLKSGLTSKSIGIGTQGYMPSEQAIGRPKYSSDIYALGMTAIQALTGKFPHELPVNNDDEIIWRNLVNVKGQLADILSKMVRFRASDRYQNAAEVLAVLNQVFPPDPPLTPPYQGGGQTPPLSRGVGGDPLITAKANYHRLDQLLAAKKWKDADQETANIMFKIMGREKERWLREEDCKNFPKDELKIIDQLWVKYSNGHFGFSVQKEIFTSAKIGGKVGIYDDDIWCKFGEEVGWKKKRFLGMNNDWLLYSNLSFEILPSNKGHLPIVCIWYVYGLDGVEGFFVGFFGGGWEQQRERESLFSSLVCNI